MPTWRALNIFPSFDAQPKMTLFTSGSWTCVMAAAAAAALAAAAAAAAALAPLLRFLWGTPGVPGVAGVAALGSMGPCFLFLCMANACLKEREGDNYNYRAVKKFFCGFGPQKSTEDGKYSFN